MNPYLFNPYYQPPQGFNAPQVPQTIPNKTNGFIGVQSEQEARSFPVGPGESVTFRDESAPYIYTKTMGSSPLDRPIFEKFKLIREDDAPAAEPIKELVDLSNYVLKEDFEEIKTQIAEVRKDVLAIKDKTKKRVIREVEVDDD